MFGETVTFGRLLEEVTDPQERLALLASNLEDQIATVFRQIAMNRFEDAIHNARRTEGELSIERIGELWAETQTAMLGDAVEITDGYRVVVVVHPALHRDAGLRLRVRVRPAARAVGLRAVRGARRRLRAAVPRPVARRRLDAARGAGQDRRRRPRRSRVLGPRPRHHRASARRHHRSRTTPPGGCT